MMIALALARAVTTCMASHFYTFGGAIHRQEDGGAIGSDLTGDIARNVMSIWDLTFLKTLESLGIIIDLYKRYVDDQLEICPPINPGWKFCTKSKVMKYSSEEAINDRDSPAIRTAKVLQNVANSIEDCIKLTFDTPDRNANEKMPVLDLEV